MKSFLSLALLGVLANANEAEDAAAKAAIANTNPEGVQLGIWTNVISRDAW